MHFPFTFAWVTPLVRRGLRTTLTQEDAAAAMAWAAPRTEALLAFYDGCEGTYRERMWRLVRGRLATSALLYAAYCGTQLAQPLLERATRRLERELLRLLGLAPRARLRGLPLRALGRMLRRLRRGADDQSLLVGGVAPHAPELRAAAGRSITSLAAATGGEEPRRKAAAEAAAAAADADAEVEVEADAKVEAEAAAAAEVAAEAEAISES